MNNKNRYIFKVANTHQPSAEPTNAVAAAATRTRTLSPTNDASQPRREVNAAAAPIKLKNTTVANTPQPSAETTASAETCKHTSKVKINK